MTDNNPIPQKDAAKMQQAASAAEKTKPEEQPVAAEAPAAPAKKAAPAAASSAISKIAVNLLVTLDMTRDELFGVNHDVFKASLSSLKIGEGEAVYNLYNPFRAVTNKTKLKNPDATRGALRSAMTTIFDVGAELEGQNVMYVGKRSDVMAVVRKTADAMQTRVQNAIGLTPDTVVCTYKTLAEGTAEEVENVITMGDLITVSSWCNTAKNNIENAEEGEAGVTANVFVHVSVASPALHGAPELDRQVLQIVQFLKNQLAKYEETNQFAPFLLFGVHLRGNSLGDPRMVELITSLNDSGFLVFDRAELIQNAASGADDWAPDTKTGVETKLLPKAGDIMFLSDMMEDEEETGGETEAE